MARAARRAPRQPLLLAAEMLVARLRLSSSSRLCTRLLAGSPSPAISACAAARCPPFPGSRATVRIARLRALERCVGIPLVHSLRPHSISSSENPMCQE